MSTAYAVLESDDPAVLERNKKGMAADQVLVGMEKAKAAGIRVLLSFIIGLGGKIGAGVFAVRRGGGTHAFDSINRLFQISRMIIPGSTYWNLGYGLEKEEVLNDDEGIANMTNLGENIAWLGKAIKPHMDSFPQVNNLQKEG